MSIDKIKAELLIKYPTLQTGSEETGYEKIVGKEYDDLITEWAEVLYAKEVEENKKLQDAAAKSALLNRLGITEEEARLLLG